MNSTAKGSTEGAQPFGPGVTGTAMIGIRCHVIEQFAAVLVFRPDRPRSTVIRDWPFRAADIGERAQVDLVAPRLVRLVRQPATVRRQSGIALDGVLNRISSRRS